MLLSPKLNLHLTVDNADLVSRHARASGPFAHAAVGERKTGKVPGTLDRISLELALFERRAVVRANGTNCVDSVARSQKQDGLPADLDAPGLPFRQSRYGAGRKKIIWPLAVRIAIDHHTHAKNHPAAQVCTS